jgi:hypothetical protein
MRPTPTKLTCPTYHAMDDFVIMLLAELSSSNHLVIIKQSCSHIKASHATTASSHGPFHPQEKIAMRSYPFKPNY